MNKLLVLALAAGFFVLFLLAGTLGGVGNASAVLIDWATSRVEEGKLSSTLPESVASGLGGLGNLLLACAGTLLLWAFFVLDKIAGWIQLAIDSFRSPSDLPFTASGSNSIDTTADDQTWAKCESLLEDAIFRGEAKLTVLLCERMHGKPYLTKAKAVDETKTGDEVPNA